MKTVLNEIDRQNALGRRSVAASTPLRSVLFPLFGTRAYGGVEPQDVTYDLFQAAIEYMTVKPNTLVERVAFLAYTDTDLEFCRTAAQRLGLVKEDDTGSAKIGDSPRSARRQHLNCLLEVLTKPQSLSGLKGL